MNHLLIYQQCRLKAKGPMKDHWLWLAEHSRQHFIKQLVKEMAKQNALTPQGKKTIRDLHKFIQDTKNDI